MAKTVKKSGYKSTRRVHLKPYIRTKFTITEDEIQ